MIQPAAFRELELQPLFRTHDARYMVYWRTATPEAYPAVLEQIEAQERKRLALEARTLDRVTPGEQQPEVEHAFSGEDTAAGYQLGRHYRDTGRFIAYRLKAPVSDRALELLLTFSGADRNDGFRLLVNERELATIRLDGRRPDEFIELAFRLPADVSSAAANGFTVKLVAGAQRTSRLFGLRLLQAAEARARP